MSFFHLLSLIEPAIGLGLALLVTAFGWPRRGPELTPRRVLVAVAGMLILTLALLIRAWMSHPWFSIDPGWGATYQVNVAAYLLPFILGTTLTVAAAWPVRGHEAAGRATLERRGVLTFTRRWWWVAMTIVLLVSIGLAVGAGLASSPDSNGQYTMYVVTPGGGTAASTLIYGWYFSVPSAGGAAVLLAVFAMALMVVARSPLRIDPALDETVRRRRARDVTAAVAGALTLHLGAVLASLGGTASLTLMFSTSVGMLTVVSTFAALGPALTIAGQLVTAVGFALWWLIVLSALTARRIR